MAGSVVAQVPSIVSENSYIEVTASGFATTNIIMSNLSVNVLKDGDLAAYRGKGFATTPNNINGTYCVLVKDMIPAGGSFVNGDEVTILVTAYVLDSVGGMDNKPLNYDLRPYVGNDLGFAMG